MSSLLSIIIISIVLAACSGQPVKKKVFSPQEFSATGRKPEIRVAAEKEMPARGKTTRCVRDGEYRTLRIINLQSKGCRLWYSSFSEAKPVAWADSDSQHCRNVRDQIIQNLGKFNFKCVHDDEKSVTFL